MLEISLVGYGVSGNGIENVVRYTRLIGWVIDITVLEAFVHLGTASTRR